MKASLVVSKFYNLKINNVMYIVMMSMYASELCNVQERSMMSTSFCKTLYACDYIDRAQLAFELASSLA